MTTPRSVFHLALRDLWAGAGAAFTEYAGWSVPAHFGDPVAEYTAIRERAAVQDLSYRSRIMVTGSDAGILLSRVFTGHPDKLEEGRAMRCFRVDTEGHIRDLVLVARTGGIAYLAIGEPGQRMETLELLNAAIEPDFDVEVGDRTLTTCLLGVTGPAAASMVREHLEEAFPVSLAPMRLAAFQFHGFRSLAVRTSSTGEDGFEFMVAPAVAQHIVESLRAAGAALAGFAAAEIARVEACIPAYQPDLAAGLLPMEAGLPGFEPPQNQLPPPRLLSAILIESSAPVPAGTPVLHRGTPIGEVTSCVHSPSLDATIALAIIQRVAASPGTTLEVAGCAAVVTAKPFFRRRL